MSIFFPCIRLWKNLIRPPGESFVIFINIRFQKWFSFDDFPLISQKTRLTFDKFVWEVVAVPKVWRILAVVSFKTGSANLAVTLE